MSAEIVVKQMVMIAMLIMLGFYSYKKKMLTHESTRGISALIVNFTNPCLMVYSMLNSPERVSGKLLLMGLFSAVATYILLIVIAEIFTRLFRVDRAERYCYWLLCIFGNIGFIGIPLTSAVLGEGALVYVCFHNLVYSLIIYTLGIRKILKEASDEAVGPDPKSGLARIVNVGTVTAVLALGIYIAGLSLPELIMSFCDYAGRSTTFLSMVVLGTAVARMSFKRVVKNTRLIVFSLVRLIGVPLLILMILKLFIKDDLIINTTALMLAVPAGNMPFIMATEYGLEADTISDGIVLSTVLSLVTIPIVTLFV